MIRKQWIYVLQIILLQNRVTGQIENHPAWNLLNSFECGESAADRIIGGKNAVLGQFPWAVRLGYDVDSDMDWMCGGTLVSNRHVVTAAHCVYRSDDRSVFVELVRVGEYDARTNPDCQLAVCAPPVQDRRVKRVWHHEKYQQPPFHNDIALIELENPVEFNDYVIPICLPQNREQLENPSVGDFVTVTGWGTTNMSTGHRADILQVLSVPVIDSSQCNNMGKQFKIEKSEICAGAEKNKDSCGGDSGGSATKVFDTPDGPKNVLVGVVSFGPTQCGNQKPGVYSSVPYFLKWILDHIII